MSVLIARLSYEYQVVHTVYIILLYSVAIYNSASFYIDVFAKRGLGVSNEWSATLSIPFGAILQYTQHYIFANE